MSNTKASLCKWIGPYLAFSLLEGIDGRGTELYLAITLRIAETYTSTNLKFCLDDHIENNNVTNNEKTRRGNEY